MDTLNSYGAKCSVAILPFIQYEKRLKNGEFDVFIGGVNFAPDLDMSFLLHSNSAYNFVLDKGENYFGYSNEVTDSLIESMRRVPNETALKTTAGLLWENVSKDLPFIGIAFRKDALILNENIFGVETPYYGNIYLNIDKWYIVG
jgi:ABC-type oligopeptide transport system substrate-binding subunit